MLIKNPNSINIYRPASFADSILDDGEIADKEWRANVVLDSFSSFQVSRTGYNASLDAKLVREKLMDYFVNDGAVEWQWKYC